MKKTVALLLAFTLLAVLAACGGSAGEPAASAAVSEPAGEAASSGKTGAPADRSPDKCRQPTIVMCAKHEGIPWFDDMRVGVEQFGKDYNLKAYQIAPEGGDPAKQAQMTEDLIAREVDAILAVPNDPKSLATVLRKAKAQGIVVVTHEASDIAADVDYDMEAFDNSAFGVLFFESLARAMNFKGKYTGFVGSLTMTTHMQWYKAGTDYVKQKYPEMQMITTQPYEDKNDIKVAYDKALEILKANPDIRGLFDMAASGAGIAQALKDNNRRDIALSSLALPSMSAEYIKSGIMSHGQAWRPLDAGYVTALIAYKKLKGEKIEDGVDLKKAGYEKCSLKGNIIFGNAPLVFTRDNVDQYKF